MTQITNNGKIITVNFDRGFDQRYYQYALKNNVNRRVVHKAESIDHQQEQFMIHAYIILVDDLGEQIPESSTKILNIPVNGSNFDQLYPLVANGLGDLAKRALNGMLEFEFGLGFYVYDPVNNLAEFQPVEFNLSVSGNSIVVNHTDGSGNYQYSLDKQNWGNNSLLQNLAPGTYQVSVKDDTSNWFRTKEITI